MLDRAARFLSLRAFGRAAAIVSTALLPACRGAATSDYVADQFADAYFRRFDQDAALAYTALGATEMLDKELRDTKAIRESYSPAEAAASVTFTHGPATLRDASRRLPLRDYRPRRRR